MCPPLVQSNSNPRTVEVEPPYRESQILLQCSPPPSACTRRKMLKTLRDREKTREYAVLFEGGDTLSRTDCQPVQLDGDIPLAPYMEMSTMNTRTASAESVSAIFIFVSAIFDFVSAKFQNGRAKFVSSSALKAAGEKTPSKHPAPIIPTYGTWTFASGMPEGLFRVAFSVPRIRASVSSVDKSGVGPVSVEF